MSKAQFEELSILTIDDSPFMLKIMKECLKAFGAKNLHEAANAVDGFEIIRANTIDLIISDYFMQPVDGREFIQMIRSQKKTTFDVSRSFC